MPAPTLADQASFDRAALFGGLLEPSQVIAWADAWIMREERVPDGLVDLSLSGGNLNRMAEALGELGPQALTEEGFRLYAALLRERWEAGELTAGEIAGVLYSLAVSRAPPGMEDGLKRFSYDFELMTFGVGTVQDVEGRLRTFLAGWA